MPRAYSEDLRVRVIRAVEEDGMSARAAGRRFGVSESTAIKWVAQYRENRRTQALPMGRPRGLKLAVHKDFIRSGIEDRDTTLDEMQAMLLAECGIYASRTLIWRFVREEGLSYKKNTACQ